MGIAHWDSLFVRPLQDWELESMVVFSALVFSTMVGRNEEDKLVWWAACSGSLEVKLYYTVLLCRNSHSFPWKGIWKVKVPSKVAFFTWTTAKGKILTLDNLRKQNIYDVNRCSMCRNDWESVDDLPLHCPYAFNLWIIWGRGIFTSDNFHLACLIFHELCLNEWLSC